jgi:hypothetical protein
MIGCLTVFIDGTTCIELEILVQIKSGGGELKTMALESRRLTELRDHSVVVKTVEKSIYSDTVSSVASVIDDIENECTGWRLVWK